MSRKPDQIENWVVYWLGIAFIVACTLLALTADADSSDPEPCWQERVTAARICQRYGEDTYACVRARQARDLCLAEHADDDPIGGVK